MDARAYFDLTDSITAATSGAVLDGLRERVSATEMHATERRVIERKLSSRANELRAADADATGSPGIAL